jgi:hypothetical protein
MGQAVLQYVPDHAGKLPPLFPGQVLEYEASRGGRIVTECAVYLGVDTREAKYLVRSLLPRVYARQTVPANPAQMRVWVMNSTVTNNGTTTNPFGSVTTPGQPPTGNMTLAALAESFSQWISAPPIKNSPMSPPHPGKRTHHRNRRSARSALFSASMDQPDWSTSASHETRRDYLSPRRGLRPS